MSGQFRIQNSNPTTKQQRAVTTWLIIGIIMIMVQIILGGITRLTGSGLSITEWKPLLGFLPPLNEMAWRQNFEKYQQIAQYKKINSDFSLADYQSIYFWEWLHREWARLMGLVFIIPFLWLSAKGWINRNMIKPMIILFLLGGLQGFIGWFMVKSGLNDTDVSVSHIRLAIHFMCAMALLVYLLWFTLKMCLPSVVIKPVPYLKGMNVLLLVLLVFQLVYGAFMAGTHAALVVPTWPDMNGACFPDGLFNGTSIIRNSIDNPVAIQFIHRNLAYVITAFMAIWYIRAGKATASHLSRVRWIPLLLVVLQIALGVLALKNSMFHIAVYYAVLHQCNGMLLLAALVSTYYLSGSRQTVKR